MPSDDTTTVRTEAEFNEQLRRLLRSAHRHGVDVEGGWECRTPPASPDWDVVVSEIASDGD